MFEGSNGLVLFIVAAVVFFCVVIGGIAWLYGRQSARKRSEIESKAGQVGSARRSE